MIFFSAAACVVIQRMVDAVRRPIAERMKANPPNYYPGADISRPSPNFSNRLGAPIHMIVVHETGDGSVEGTLSWFQNPISQVSAHFVIGKDGKTFQCVPEEKAAWHCKGVNVGSIGIEVVAKDGETMTAMQDDALVRLCAYLLAKHKLNAQCITGHRFASNTPKPCPGAIFGERTLAAIQAWASKIIY